MYSMLIELRIENFGIIESQKFFPKSDLNIISGETGSGKSLLLSALNFVLGARATVPRLLRSGSNKAVVEAIFDLQEFPQEARKKLPPEAEIESHDYLELRREISLEGRNRIYCNGNPITLQNVRSFAPHLIEVHGQHEHQRMLEPDTHLEFLDLFAETQELSSEVADLYHQYRNLCSRLHNMSLETEERENRRNFLNFVLEEIESFQPSQEEWEQLNQEKAVIDNSGKLFQDLQFSYQILREEESSLLEKLNSVLNSVEAHQTILPELQEHCKNIKEAGLLLDLAADYMREQKDKLQFSSEQQERIHERLAGYQSLFKKYGGSLPAILHTLDKYTQEFSSIEMSREEMEKIQDIFKTTEKELFEKAKILSRMRRSVIPSLEEKLAEELNLLGMPSARIHIEVKQDHHHNEENIKDDTVIKNFWQTDEKYNSGEQGEKIHNNPILKKNKYIIHEKGLDRVEFLLLANLGETPHPLRKIASGGELSRISLALKSIFFHERPVGTLLFDEVDAGVGGETAHIIGKRLKSLAEKSQVLVVTHLPQLASLAEHHFCISKEHSEGRTYAKIRSVHGEERLREMSRMLGGEGNSSAVREHARELLTHIA